MMTRSEIKFLVPKNTSADIRTFFEENATLDIHCQGKYYLVETVYLLNWKNENSSGKLRIRKYFDDNIYLEEKLKINNERSKNRVKITKNYYERLIATKDSGEIFKIVKALNMPINKGFYDFAQMLKVHMCYKRYAWDYQANQQKYRITIDESLSVIIDTETKQNNMVNNEMSVLEIKGESIDNALLAFIENTWRVFPAKFSKFIEGTKQMQRHKASTIIDEYNGLENEIKLSFDYDIDWLDCALSVLEKNNFILEKRKNKQYEDIYFDTYDKFFLNNNYSYRVRVGEDRILNFKIPNKFIDTLVFSREEYKCILDNSSEIRRISEVKCLINDMVSRLTDSRRISQVLTLGTTREFFWLKTKIKTDFQAIGVLCIDHSKIYSADADGYHPIPPQVEIEFLFNSDANTNTAFDKKLLERLLLVGQKLIEHGFCFIPYNKYEQAYKLLCEAKI